MLTNRTELLMHWRPRRAPEPPPEPIRHLRLVARAFDWQRDVPELRRPPVRVVEAVEVDGRTFYVSRVVEVDR